MVGVLVIWCRLHVPGPRLEGKISVGPGCLSVSHTGGWGKENETRLERLTALEAHRAGKLHLPPGYRLEYGADVLLLRRAAGSVVAALNARGATPSEVARTAEEDYRANGKSNA